MKNGILDIMLDLEFFGTEEDMINEYAGEDAFPIVSSIGMVIQLDGKVVYSNNYALNFREQLDNDAKFGKICMLEFWTKQPLLGQELARTMGQDEPIELTLKNLADTINTVRSNFSDQIKEVKVSGNNLLADNAKVIRLFNKYSYSSSLPWSYFENMDYREYIKTAIYLGFDRRMVEAAFEKEVVNGSFASFGFNEPALHNAEYDCFKQLYTLNAAREFLALVKKECKGAI